MHWKSGSACFEPIALTVASPIARSISNESEILGAASALLASIYPFPEAIRLLGVTLSALGSADRDDDQFTLSL
ncbi:hypothetical protein IB238_04075 [Rhizobium sp. ARZ01]|uniref:DinB/UmuC family translesion DNA polymerase n=1 Tax=Rhizobium sp. ARZ01 TaxID=2769313 RepID=UPI001783EED6|nr:hypothetical protein [Rhizobium sp. ARZ01]MBD9371817.1 hypothetical protein [Rhizobium sp. ARZ01]